MAGNDAAGGGIPLAPQEALTLRLGVLRRVDFEELGADLLAVYRYDFQAREAQGPKASVRHAVLVVAARAGQIAVPLVVAGVGHPVEPWRREDPVEPWRRENTLRRPSGLRRCKA
jgi:hypothetical protein